MNNVLEVESELTDIRGLAKLIDISVSTARRLDVAGKVPVSLKIGGSKKWRISELKEWICEGCPSRVKWEKMKNVVN